MSSAKKVQSAGGEQRITWLVVEDDGGQVWKYSRTNNTVDAEEVVVLKGIAGNAAFVPTLIPGEDGRPLFRQDEDGLPTRIIVGFDDPLM